MKFPKLITRRRAKWTGLATTVLLAAALISSYWVWPSYSWSRTRSSVAWKVGIDPGGITTRKIELVGASAAPFADGWTLRSRRTAPTHMELLTTYPTAPPPTFVWLPKHKTISGGLYKFQFQSIPFWMPLVLLGVPTSILFYRDRKPKPGCCAKCRYDLTGLSGVACPECGTESATTDSQRTPASTAGGENGVS